MERLDSWLTRRAWQTWCLSDSRWLFSVSRFSVAASVFWLFVLLSVSPLFEPVKPSSEPWWNLYVLAAWGLASFRLVMKLFRSMVMFSLSMSLIVESSWPPARNELNV